MITQSQFGLKRAIVKTFLSVKKCCTPKEGYKPCPACHRRIMMFIALTRKLLKITYPEGMPVAGALPSFDPDFTKRLTVMALLHNQSGIGVLFQDPEKNTPIQYQIPTAQVEKIILGEYIDEEGGDSIY